MDTVLRSSRTNKTRTNKSSSSLKNRFIAVEAAEYLKGHQLRLRFNDGKNQVVDFGPFLEQSTNPLIRQYLELNKFKSFRITNGDLEWNDYDLCFPIADLYYNRLTKESGS
ncbi:MAG TPA: DUF2442 domain-containing protein [Anaerolineae bacterium]|nr:DUF2442 domain-containing protein [Anaerolineae bacterium]